MASKNKAVKKSASKGASKNAKQVPQKRKYTRSQPETHAKLMTETYELKPGIPLSRLKSSDEEKVKIHNTLKAMKPKEQHIAVSSRLKSSFYAIAKRDFPEMQLKSSMNSTKGVVSIWREK